MGLFDFLKEKIKPAPIEEPPIILIKEEDWLKNVKISQKIKDELYHSIAVPINTYQVKPISIAFRSIPIFPILLASSNHSAMMEFCRTLAKSLNVQVFYINIFTLTDPSNRESERDLIRIFKQADKIKPTILFFDYIDLLFKYKDVMSRGSTVEYNFLKILREEVKEIIDKAKPIGIIAMSNTPRTADETAEIIGIKKVLYFDMQ